MDLAQYLFWAIFAKEDQRVGWPSRPELLHALQTSVAVYWGRQGFR